jgi:FdhE protein
MTQSMLIEQTWAERRRRTSELIDRYEFAVEVLRLYGALLDVQERAFVQVRAGRPGVEDAAIFAASRVLPAVMDATVAAGPPQLAESVRDGRESVDGEILVLRWLHGEEQSPVDQFLARASAAPVLEALGGAIGAACRGPRDERHCPVCGGAPQLSVVAPSGESLVTGRRQLVCARCQSSWAYPRMTCAACGETSSARLVVLAEQGTSAGEATGHVVPGAAAVRGDPTDARAKFPHLRVEACETCHRYLIGVDLARDGRAVPLVDELAAIPLDLYAQERGLTKVIPNLMGI